MTDAKTVFLIVPAAEGEVPEPDRVAHALSTTGEEWRRFGHVWLVLSSSTSDAIRDLLLNQPGLSGSRIMVVSAARDAAWWGLADADTDWLVNRL